MTNTEKITINQTLNQRGLRAMQGYVDINQEVIRTRINDLRAEAADERLAAAGRPIAGSGIVRRRVGTFLIHAGVRLAGGPLKVGSPATHATRRMAA